MHTDANNMKKKSRYSDSNNTNTSDVKLTFEDFIEKEDILHYMADKFTSNPLKLLIGILPKVSKRCGAAAEQALAIIVEVVIEPFSENVTDKISAVIGRCPNIKKLSLQENQGIDVKPLLEALKTNSVLQKLECAATRPFLYCQ